MNSRMNREKMYRIINVNAGNVQDLVAGSLKGNIRMMIRKKGTINMNIRVCINLCYGELVLQSII